MEIKIGILWNESVFKSRCSESKIGHVKAVTRWEGEACSMNKTQHLPKNKGSNNNNSIDWSCLWEANK